jgi:hypothetical protein
MSVTKIRLPRSAPPVSTNQLLASPSVVSKDIFLFFQTERRRGAVGRTRVGGEAATRQVRVPCGIRRAGHVGPGEEKRAPKV